MQGQYSENDIKDLYDQYIYHLMKQRNPSYKLNINFKYYVVSMCEKLDLPFRNAENHVFIDAYVYEILKTFYLNQASYLKGKEEFISFRDVCKIFQLDNSSFGQGGGEEWKRKRWNNFMQVFKPKMHYQKQFWFSLKEVNNVKESYLSILDIQKILKEEHGIDLTEQTIYQRLSEFRDESLTFLGRFRLYPKNVLEFLLEQEDPNYIEPNDAAILLDLYVDIVRKYAKDNKLFPNTKKVKNKILLYKNDVDKWFNFKNGTIPLKDVLVETLQEHGYKLTQPFGKDHRLKYIRNQIILLKKKLKLISAIETPFRAQDWWIYTKNKSEVKSAIQKKIAEFEMLANKDRIDRLKLYSKKKQNKKAPNTMSEFCDYALKRFKKRKNLCFPPIKSIYDLLLSLEKELTECTDDDIQELIKELSEIKTSKESFTEFIHFINGIQKKYTTTYTDKYSAKQIPDQVGENKPYTKEQYFRFGLLLLNDSHEWYTWYLEKALKKRVYANAWLFGLLHYVCAWRASDMKKTIPCPKLPINQSTGKVMTYGEFFQLVMNGKFTEQMALEIVLDVKMQIEYLNIKPKKTAKHNPSNLVWEIPESVVYPLGMLLGLNEAHRQKKKGKTLLTHECNLPKIQKEFFGPELEGIFKGGPFLNKRGNKTFEILMTKKADDEQLGSGYILASIARSHKFSPEKLSNTTAIYLQYFGSITNSEILMRELFERGVCSFVPYLLLKTLQSEEEVLKLSPTQQTAYIKNLVPYSDSPYDVEMLVKTHNDVMVRAKKDVQDIINFYTVNGNADIKGIQKFIDRIACGTASAKEKNMNCIWVAKGLGCLYPERETCVGCGQEIYLKSSLHVLGQKMREQVNKLANSKTQSEKLKCQLISQNVFKPILKDIIVTLVNVYGVKNVTEYQKIVMGNSLTETSKT